MWKGLKDKVKGHKEPLTKSHQTSYRDKVKRPLIYSQGPRYTHTTLALLATLLLSCKTFSWSGLESKSWLWSRKWGGVSASPSLCAGEAGLPLPWDGGTPPLGLPTVQTCTRTYSLQPIHYMYSLLTMWNILTQTGTDFWLDKVIGLYSLKSQGTCKCTNSQLSKNKGGNISWQTTLIHFISADKSSLHYDVAWNNFHSAQHSFVTQDPNCNNIIAKVSQCNSM